MAYGSVNIGLPDSGKAEIPQAGEALGGVRTTSPVTDSEGYTACPIIDGVVYYRDTDTVYQEATVSRAGLMSAADKAKLEGLGTGSGDYVLPVAGTALGGVRTTSTVHDAAGYTPVPIIDGVPYYKDTDTVYQEATVSRSGLMSAADKAKLEGLGTGSGDYVLPAAGTALGGVRTTSAVSDAAGYTPVPIIDGVPYYKDTDTVYQEATAEKAGLMSAGQVQKLAGIPGISVSETAPDAPEIGDIWIW